jgi:hypothetical protein
MVMDSVPRKGTRVRITTEPGCPLGTVEGQPHDAKVPDELIAGADVLVRLDDAENEMFNPVRVHIWALVLASEYVEPSPLVIPDLSL